jgi:hypothetical protein
MTRPLSTRNEVLYWSFVSAITGGIIMMFVGLHGAASGGGHAAEETHTSSAAESGARGTPCSDNDSEPQGNPAFAGDDCG